MPSSTPTTPAPCYHNPDDDGGDRRESAARGLTGSQSSPESYAGRGLSSDNHHQPGPVAVPLSHSTEGALAIAFDHRLNQMLQVDVPALESQQSLHEEAHPPLNADRVHQLVPPHTSSGQTRPDLMPFCGRNISKPAANGTTKDLMIPNGPHRALPCSSLMAEPAITTAIATATSTAAIATTTLTARSDTRSVAAASATAPVLRAVTASTLAARARGPTTADYMNAAPALPREAQVHHHRSQQHQILSCRAQRRALVTHFSPYLNERCSRAILHHHINNDNSSKSSTGNTKGARCNVRAVPFDHLKKPFHSQPTPVASVRDSSCTAASTRCPSPTPAHFSPDSHRDANDYACYEDSRRNDDTDENDDSPGHSLVPWCEPDQVHLLSERAPSSLAILQEPCVASNFGRPGENYKNDFRDIISRDSNTDDRDSSYDDDNDENEFSGERATVLFYPSPWRQSSSFPSSYYPRPPDSQTLSALVRVIAAEGEGSVANLANATETLATSSTQSALPTAATTPHSDQVYPRGISCPALALNPLVARLCARAMADAREQQRELRVYYNNMADRFSLDTLQTTFLSHASEITRLGREGNPCADHNDNNVSSSSCIPMRYGYDSVTRALDQPSEVHIQGGHLPSHSTDYSASAFLSMALPPLLKMSAVSKDLGAGVASALAQRGGGSSPRTGAKNSRCVADNDMYNKARKTSVGMDHSLGHFGDVTEARDISGGVLSLAMPSTPGYLDLTLGPHNKTIYSFDHPSSRYAVLGKRRRQSISEFAYGATEVSGWEQTLPAQGQSGANQSFEPLCPARANPTRSFRLPPCPQRQQQGRISVPMTMMVAMNGTGSAPMTRGQAVNVSSRDTRANAAPASAFISEGRIGSGEHESSTAYEGAAFTWSTSSGSDGMHSGQFPLPHYLGGNNHGNDRGNNVNEDHDRDGADNDNETDYDRDRHFSTAQTTPVQGSVPHEQQHTSRHQAQPQHSMPVHSSPSAGLHQQRQHAMERILPGSTSMSRHFPVLPAYPQVNEPIAHQIRRAQSSHIHALQRQWERQQQEQQQQRQQSGAVIEAREASLYTGNFPIHITTGSSVATHASSRAHVSDSELYVHRRDHGAETRRQSVGGIPMSRGSAIPPAPPPAQSSLSMSTVLQTTSATATSATALVESEPEHSEQSRRRTHARGSNTIYVNYEGGTLKPDDKWRRGDQEMIGR